MRKVGILGSGDVGQALGRGFARHGWDVKLGSREPQSAKLTAWLAAAQPAAASGGASGGQAGRVAGAGGAGALSTGTFAQAAQHGDVVVLATHGAGTEAALDLAGPKNFAGKLVLDATNPLDFSKGMPPGLFVGTTDSLGERVQRKLPGAQVVKCFNTISNARMVDPAFRDGTPPMMVCGDDAGAKQRTQEILKELGWPGILDCGGIDGARWLEALVPLWVRAGARLNTWGHAFRVVQ